jgi:hypothetical protein
MHMLKKAEYEKQYSTGIPAAQDCPGQGQNSGFFQEEVLPPGRSCRRCGIPLRTLADGRDVDLIVHGYASPLIRLLKTAHWHRGASAAWSMK